MYFHNLIVWHINLSFYLIGMFAIYSVYDIVKCDWFLNDLIICFEVNFFVPSECPTLRPKTMHFKHQPRHHIQKIINDSISWKKNFCCVIYNYLENTFDKLWDLYHLIFHSLVSFYLEIDQFHLLFDTLDKSESIIVN